MAVVSKTQISDLPLPHATYINIQFLIFYSIILQFGDRNYRD